MYLKRYKVTEIEGINVYKIPSKDLQATGCGIAIAVRFFFANGYYIFVDDVFTQITEMNKQVADFILAHELGHIKLGHLNVNAYVRNIQHEIEADTYAIGKTSTHDAFKFTVMVKGIEKERVDNIYEIYKKGVE